ARHADAPAPDIAAKMELYGRFVGSWQSDIVTHAPDGGRHSGHGEIHFGWVLQGRAIQDVWMIPRRSERVPGASVMPVAGNWYGTTLRVFDPGIDAWHILGRDRATQFFTRQLGRARGDDIVQEGADADGALMRWSFTRIRPDSFHWLGERSGDGGASWQLQVEVLARRAAA